MSGAIRSLGNPGTGSANFHIGIRQRHLLADLIEGAAGNENRKGVGKYNLVDQQQNGKGGGVFVRRGQDADAERLGQPHPLVVD